MVSNWFNILKIKTPDGAWLINSAGSFQEWKKRLQKLLEDVVLQEFKATSTRDKERSRVRVTQDPVGNPRTKLLESDETIYQVSFRHPFTEVSCSIDFLFKKNPEADNLYYVTAIGYNLGPNFVYDINYEVGNEGAFLEEIVDRVGEYMETSKPQGGGQIPSIEEEEGRKTQAQLAQELARENPGYQMVEGQMRDLGDMKRLASRRGISLEQLLARLNLTFADFMVNLPQETNTPPPPPRPEVPDVGAQKRENLRMNRQRTGPIRRKRPPKDEEQ